MTEMNLENFEPQIIKTQDENGEIHEFELIDILSLDEQDYGLLLYVDPNEEEKEESDEEEVIVMRLGKEGEAFTFESIEDEDEFNKVIEILNQEAELEEE